MTNLKKCVCESEAKGWEKILYFYEANQVRKECLKAGHMNAKRLFANLDYTPGKLTPVQPKPGRMMESGLLSTEENLILTEDKNRREVHRWGNSIKDEVIAHPNDPRLQVRRHESFDSTEVLRAISASSKDPQAWDSFEEVKLGLSKAHNAFPAPSEMTRAQKEGAETDFKEMQTKILVNCVTNGHVKSDEEGLCEACSKVYGDTLKRIRNPMNEHGPHCRTNVFTQADCVANNHHLGFWHSPEAIVFSEAGDVGNMLITTQRYDKTDEAIFEGEEGTVTIRSGLKAHSCILGPDNCTRCKWNEMILELKETQEGRHDERPSINERRHARHQERLHQPHAADGEKTEDQVRADIQWQGNRCGGWATMMDPPIYTSLETGERNVVVDEDGYFPATIPERRVGTWWQEHAKVKVPVVVKTEGYWGRGLKLWGKSKKWGRKTNLGTIVHWIPASETIVAYKEERCECGACDRTIDSVIKPGDPTRFKDTGKLPEKPQERRLSVPKPFLDIEEVRTQYVDNKRQDDRWDTLVKVRQAWLKAVHSTKPTNPHAPRVVPPETINLINRLKNQMKTLENPSLREPKIYTFNNGAWASGERVMDKNLFQAVRDRARDVIKNMTDWGSSLGEMDKVSLVSSPILTKIAQDKGIIGKGTKYPHIEDIPEPVTFFTKEQVENGKVKMKMLNMGKGPVGKLPFRGYHCWKCRHITPHMKDVFPAGRMDIFHQSIYGNSGHWKCYACGSVLKRKALKVSVRFKMSGKPDAAIWTVVGWAYGDGFVDQFLNWHEQHSTQLWQSLEAGREAQAMVKAVPVLKESAQEDLNTMFGVF